jgi:imidazolonepropionase-like amidohydrolase
VLVMFDFHSFQYRKNPQAAIAAFRLAAKQAPSLGLVVKTQNGEAVPEALAGVTRHAAQALGLQATHGSIAVACPANFVLWPVGDVAELAYWLGQRPACSVVRQGRLAVDGMGLQRSSA